MNSAQVPALNEFKHREQRSVKKKRCKYRGCGEVIAILHICNSRQETRFKFGTYVMGERILCLISISVTLCFHLSIAAILLI